MISFKIETLGFRGEALASIGSVAHLTITSRIAGSSTGAACGWKLVRLVRLEMVGTPVGTVVTVEDLFYNVPARLKFLKHPTTERRHIDEMVTRYALAYPQCAFSSDPG